MSTQTSSPVATAKAVSKSRRIQLVDKFVELDRQIKDLEKIRAELGNEIKDKLGVGTYAGKEHEVQVLSAFRTSLDQAVVKGFLTPAQILAASKESNSVQIRVRF